MAKHISKTVVKTEQATKLQASSIVCFDCNAILFITMDKSVKCYSCGTDICYSCEQESFPDPIPCIT